MTISVHARKLAWYLATQSMPIDSQDETWLVKHVQRAIDAAISDLIRQGMGDAPMSQEMLTEMRAGAVSELHEPELLDMIDLLQARIAFLCQDNESWQDGYRRGLEDGREAEREAAAKADSPYQAHY